MPNNLAAFTPIKFSLKLIELLYNDTLYPSITNTNYEGIIKESGDRVRVRTAARVSLSAYTKGMALVTQDLNPTSEDMIIDQQQYFKFGVDDVDKFQNDIPAIAAYAGETKDIMTEVIDTDLLAYMAKNVGQSADSSQTANVVATNYATGTVSIAATTGVVTGVGTTFTASMVGGYLKATGHTVSYLITGFTSTTVITVTDLAGTGYTGGVITGAAYTIAGAVALAITSSNIYQHIVSLRTALGRSLSPKEGRFMVVNAQFEGLLLQCPQFIPAVQTAYSDVVVKGLIGSIAGFKILSTELISGNNTTGYWFVAGTKDFCSFACQIMKTSVVPSESDPNSFVSVCKGLLVYGRKVFAGNRARGAVLRATLA